MPISSPTGVNKILVEKYGYEWVNGKAWRPGTAPKPEVPTIDVTPGPLPDWITPPPADAFVTQALETLTNPVTGEKFTAPTGGYTVNVSAPTPIEDTSPAPSLPVATPEAEPSPVEPVSLEEKIEQLQASLSELQKKYEEALEKLDQANARIAELEGKQSETPVEDQSSSDLDVKPEATPSPEPEPEPEPSKPEAPAVEAPPAVPAPSFPEPTGVNKILVEKYGYEWVNGKAWKPGTAPEATSPATTVTNYEINPDNALQTIVTNAIAAGDPEDDIELDLRYLENAGTKLWNFSAQTIELPAKYGYEITALAPTTAYFDGDYIDLSEVVKFTEINLFNTKGDDFIYLKGFDKEFDYEGFDVENYGNDVLIGDFNYAVALHDLDGIAFDPSIVDGNFDMETPNGSIHAEQIYRLDGNDLANTLTGDDNNNLHKGDDGDDIIYGNGGDDDLGGRRDNDQLFGGEGNDRLDGGPGDDSLTGGPGNDTFVFKIDDDTNSFGHDKILDFTAGEDTLEFYDQDWNWLTLDSFTETFNADNQRVLTLKEADSSSITIIEEIIEVPEQTLIGTEGNDVLTGGPGNDAIQGLGGDDNLQGLGGNDTLNGADGDDALDGGDGNDIINGGAGDDIINDGLGDDIVDAGEGSDTYSRDFDVTNPDGGWIPHVDLENEGLFAASFPGVKGDELKNFENVILKGSLDTIVTGDENGNFISTGNGADKLFGKAGNDTLDGGAGNDTLTGGAGSDTFVFGLNFGNDIITDFERGVDVLNYEGVALVGTTLDGDELLSFKDGSSITLKGTESSNPTHNSFSVGENIFTLVSSAKSYQEATEYAAEIGAKLISFEDEQNFDGFYDALSNVITVKDLAPTTAQDGGGATYIWLGATDQVTEGTWIWESGSQMSFNNWGSGAYGSEPDNFDNQDGLAIGLENWPVGSSDGAGYGDAGYWNDVDLSNELFFVIEVL